MKVQSPIDFIRSSLTPEQRAEGHRKINEYLADVATKQKAIIERQSRQAAAQNEIEFTGENQ